MTELNENKTNNKNYVISTLRFLAMSFIVLCHFMQYYEIELAWWFNVGVQMFFCISGFLYSNKRITSPIDFICKNFKKILIPYYCFLLPTILLYFVFAPESLGSQNLLSALLCSGTINGIEHFWFIPYILFCYLITPYLQALADKMRTTKWYIFLGIFFILMLCGKVFSEAFGSYFIFSRIFCYLFGYFASVFSQEYKQKLFNTLTWLLAIVTILLNAVRIYCKYISHCNFQGFTLYEQYSHSLLGISIVLLFLIFIKNIKNNIILELSDKYSFHVYIVHQLFILSPFTLLTVTKHNVLNWIITIIAITLSAVLLKFVSDVITRYYTTILATIKNKSKF